MKGKTVVILEDDQTLQESVRRMAEELGYQVLTARSLGEAESVLSRIARPCLILVDSLMKDGLQALAQLGQRYPLATIPVRVSENNVRRMSKKSVHLDLLREAIKQHCGGA